MPSSAKPDQLALVVDELLMLVQETIDYRTEEEVTKVLEAVLRILINLRRRLELSNSRYVVAMVGLSNVGKSTLLNALLGSDLAPRRNGPCTAAPIEFTCGSDYRVTAYYRHQLRRPVWNCDHVGMIHERLSALADDSGAEASCLLDKVVVEAPHPLLAGGLIIADTPGFGAAQPADAQGSHEAALRNYLKDDVAQVFWVVLAEQGIGKREKSFHDELFAKVCDDVVVTGCEAWSREDRDRFKQRYARCFEHRMPTFHFASGLAGITARTANDQQALETAGITLLENRIRQLANSDERSSAIESSLLQLADDLGRWMREYGTRRDARSANLWRPDSWGRWKTVAACDVLVRQLTEMLEVQS